MIEIIKKSEIKEMKIQGGRTNPSPTFYVKPVIIAPPSVPTDKK